MYGIDMHTEEGRQATLSLSKQELIVSTAEEAGDTILPMDGFPVGFIALHMKEMALWGFELYVICPSADHDDVCIISL